MKFEKTSYFSKLKPFKLELEFGNYYLCEKFVVGELFEGVHLDWDMTKALITKIHAYYGKDAKIAYIANRVNAYSIDPQNWKKTEKNYNILIAGAIVVYNNSSYINASLEKLFTEKSLKRCLSLTEAIEWVESLKEFK